MSSCIIFEVPSVKSSWSESSLICSTAFKASFQKKLRGKRALASQLCRGRELAGTGRREESKRVSREEATRHVKQALHAQESKAKKIFIRVFEKYR